MAALPLTGDALLDIAALEAGYGSSTVLFGVDLAVAPGEIVGLLGRNGMGKSTLVKAVMGVVPVRGGSVAFDGRAIAGLPPTKVSRLGLAVVPEGRQVFPNLTVTEHLTAFHRPAVDGTSAWTPARAFDVFPRLAERRHHLGNQLSGGEQQMLAIARALMINPRLLILDEATEGLAPLMRDEIWRALAGLRAAGQSMIVIDKYVQRIVALADRCVILEKGRVAWSGTAGALGAEPELWHRHLGA